MNMKPDKITFERMIKTAWETRENAFVVRPNGTKVGCAVLSEEGEIFGGCNIEHEWGTQAIHAEPCAIANMIAHGRKRIEAVLIVAERHKFTPCGSCCDLIVRHGGLDVLVAYQNEWGAEVHFFKMSELMPHYPH